MAAFSGLLNRFGTAEHRRRARPSRFRSKRSDAGQSDSAQLWQDMVCAQEVQQKLFPARLPSPNGWEFAAECRPARLVAGDYYDVFEVRSGQIAIALGDVSGKGLGASLVMARMHALIRAELPDRTGNLVELLQHVNQYLYDSTAEETFVTLFLGLLDATTGMLRYANAGHPRPILLPAPGQELTQLAEGGLVLGIAPEIDISEGEILLRPGCVMAVFSDGITEARDGRGRMLREMPLAEALRLPDLLSASSTVARVLDLVRGFRRNGRQEDDMTLVIVRRLMA